MLAALGRIIRAAWRQARREFWPQQPERLPGKFPWAISAEPVPFGTKLFRTDETLYYADGKGGVAKTKVRPKRRPF